MKTHSTESCCKSDGIKFAFFLIGVGAILLMAKLELFAAGYSRVFISWQMVLIFIGLYQLLKARLVAALLFISVGGFFIVPRVAEVPHSFIQSVSDNYFGTYWPVLLIIGGLLIVLHMIISRYQDKKHEYFFGAYVGGDSYVSETKDGYFYKKCSFQSSEHILLDPIFKGGTLIVSFGELTIDLRKTDIPLGETKLHLDVSFGEITILVPEDWNIKTNLHTSFCEFKDKRHSKLHDIESQKQLLISGKVVFGGGEIRN